MGSVAPYKDEKWGALLTTGRSVCYFKVLDSEQEAKKFIETKLQELV